MDCIQWQVPPMPQLVTAGHGTWRPGMQHFRRSFDLYDIIFVKSGCLYMEEDGVEYAIGPNHLLVLEPGKVHEGVRPCEMPTELYWFHVKHDSGHRLVNSDEIPWSLALRKGTDKDLQPGMQPVYIPKSGAFRMDEAWPALDRLVKLHDRLTVDAVWRLQAAFVQLLSVMQQFVRGAATETRTSRLAEEVSAYLRHTAFEPFDIEALEREFHFHPDYIARCMKRHTGMSPVEYVRHVRVDRARRLLERSPELSVKQVAEAVGIADPNYFGRLFRKDTGMSPAAYRRLHAGYA
ncbi:helix-turn-helix domain-containing protein [Cohnella sp. GCM10012308]|uniref:AraC family transcriptional regulator n=1 Tax=Cohnella sp. GCM10012308 TaxID=3317329 RepID=UPI0036127AF0